jgi:hypothetical protein
MLSADVAADTAVTVCVPQIPLSPGIRTAVTATRRSPRHLSLPDMSATASSIMVIIRASLAQG